MKKEFWHEKWQANDLGFHQDRPHPLLQKHAPELEPGQGSRVFVPLCGKSVDMLYLRALGYEVVGLELSEIAAQSFFEENRLQVDISSEAGFRLFRGEGLTLVCGDFFSVSTEVLGTFAAVYDRAALIALPPGMRPRYAKHMQSLCQAATQFLLITLEYEEGLINAPPFTVLYDEVMNLYDGWCEVALLEKAEAVVKGKPCHELAYKLRVT